MSSPPAHATWTTSVGIVAEAPRVLADILAIEKRARDGVDDDHRARPTEGNMNVPGAVFDESPRLVTFSRAIVEATLTLSRSTTTI